MSDIRAKLLLLLAAVVLVSPIPASRRAMFTRRGCIRIRQSIRAIMDGELKDGPSFRCIGVYRDVLNHILNRILNQARGITGASSVAIANTIRLDSAIPAIPLDLEGHPIEASQTLEPMFWGLLHQTISIQNVGHRDSLWQFFTDADSENSDLS